MTEAQAVARTPELKVPIKAISMTVGALLTGLGILGTMHASLVVPSIMNQVADKIDAEIHNHLNHPHPDAIGRSEFVSEMKARDDVWQAKFDARDALWQAKFDAMSGSQADMLAEIRGLREELKEIRDQ